MTARATLARILERCDGAVAGALFRVDGLSVASVVRGDTVDVRALTFEIGELSQQVVKVAQILEVGRLDELLIRSDQVTVLVRGLTDRYLLTLALGPQGNLGKGRYLMRLAASELRKQLGTSDGSP